MWNFRSHTNVDLDNGYVKTIEVQNQVLGNVIAGLDHSAEEEKRTIESNSVQTENIISSKQDEFFENILQNAKADINLERPPLKSPSTHEPLAIILSPQVEVSRVSKLQLEPLGINHNITIMQLEESPAVIEDYNKPYNGWNLGVAQSYDVNFVNSDITLGYLGDQIESGLSGHSVNINIGRRFGPVEISSGLGYSSKSYAPGLHTQYQKASANSSAFLQSQLDKISFEQLQIPLSVKLFAAPKQRTSFYLVAGAVANVLLNTEYSIRRSIQANARPTIDPRANIIDLDSPPLGLGDGGNLKDNLYATGIIGFGVQSYLDNGVSWFIQPQYHHTITKDINEVANEINTLSFTAGLSFSL